MTNDFANDLVCFLKYVQIPVPDDTPTLSHEVFVPSNIKGNPFVMRLSVEFDDELYEVTGEVGEVRTDRVLATELEAGLLSAESAPQNALGLGFVRAHFTSALHRRAASESFACRHPPAPT
jgi:hypothetical protein